MLAVNQPLKRLTLILSLLICSHVVQAQLTWTQVQTPVFNDLEKVTFVNGEVGWTYTNTGQILKSEDEGMSWQIVYNDTSKSFWGMHWLNETTGCFSGIEVFLKTTDGGETWQDLSFGDPTNQYDCVFFVTELIGYVAVFNPVSSPQFAVHKTLDGGQSWTLTSYNNGGGILHNFDFVDENNGYISSLANVSYTINGGTTWSQASTSTAEAFQWVDVLDMNNVWAPTDSGEVNFKTGGNSWSWVDLTANDFIAQVEMLSPNYGVAVGEYDRFWLKDGAAWNLTTGITGSENILGVWIENESSMWLSTSNGKIFRGQVTPTDAKVYENDLPDTICGPTTFNASAQLLNYGNNPIANLDLEIYVNSNLKSTVNWAGTFAPTQIVTVDLGSFTISEPSEIVLRVKGDSITYNNEFSHSITYISNQTAGVVSPIEACVGDVVDLIAWGGETYLWYQGGPNGQDIIGDSTIQVTINSNNQFHVLIQQDYCQFEDSIVVQVGSCSETTAFSPNGDAVNDFLFIENLRPATGNEVNIYNRWGDGVNQFYNYDNESVFWTGNTFNGSELPAGTYYYTVAFSDGSEPLKSWVQLVK